ncbi:MAG: hypothetical protein AB8C46_24345 [Burkholderiaceae bacterium]
MNLLLSIFVALVLIALILAVSARLLTRADQRRRARADFNAFMKAIFHWTEQRDDLSRMRDAMEAIESHKQTILQIQISLDDDLYLSRARRDYLKEYERLQRRHNALIKRSKSSKMPAGDEKLYATAVSFQDAVISLTRGTQTQAQAQLQAKAQVEMEIPSSQMVASG